MQDLFCDLLLFVVLYMCLCIVNIWWNVKKVDVVWLLCVDGVVGFMGNYVSGGDVVGVVLFDGEWYVMVV